MISIGIENDSSCVDKIDNPLPPLLPKNFARTYKKRHGESASAMEEYHDNWSVTQKNSWFDTIVSTLLIWKIVIITLRIINFATIVISLYLGVDSTH